MIKDDNELIKVIRSGIQKRSFWEFRRRFNPHHSEEQIEYEALHINLELNKIDQQVLEYANHNSILLLTSSDPTVREYGEQIASQLPKGSYEDHVSFLKLEEQRINERLNELSKDNRR